MTLNATLKKFIPENWIFLAVILRFYYKVYIFPGIFGPELCEISQKYRNLALEIPPKKNNEKIFLKKISVFFSANLHLMPQLHLMPRFFGKFMCGTNRMTGVYK